MISKEHKSTKGIILAGGLGTRLYPLTSYISKQLLPVYDKPMIYYPLSVLMLAGIKEVLIITTREYDTFYKKLLSDGSQLGMSFVYIIQEKPKGIVEAFILGESFIGNDNVCLILGDNIFYSHELSKKLEEAILLNSGAVIFGYPVKDSKGFGVIEVDCDNRILSIEEKPSNPKSNYIIPGIYFYDHNVVKYAKKVEPSNRGELEITDLNNLYLQADDLKVILLGRGVTWFDTGTIDNLKSASDFVELIQLRQGFYVACIEEIAWKKGFISKQQLETIGVSLVNSDYGKYILSL